MRFSRYEYCGQLSAVLYEMIHGKATISYIVYSNWPNAYVIKGLFILKKSLENISYLYYFQMQNSS